MARSCAGFYECWLLCRHISRCVNSRTLRCRFHFALYAQVLFVFSHVLLLNLLQYICRKESLLPDHNCKGKTQKNLILCWSHLFSAGMLDWRGQIPVMDTLHLTLTMNTPPALPPVQSLQQYLGTADQS